MNPIKKLMTNGFTISEIAQKCNVSNVYIHYLKSNKKSPSIKTISKLANISNGILTIDEIVRYYAADFVSEEELQGVKK